VGARDSLWGHDADADRLMEERIFDRGGRSIDDLRGHGCNRDLHVVLRGAGDRRGLNNGLEDLHGFDVPGGHDHVGDLDAGARADACRDTNVGPRGFNGHEARNRRDARA